MGRRRTFIEFQLKPIAFEEFADNLFNHAELLAIRKAFGELNLYAGFLRELGGERAFELGQEFL